MTDSRSGWAAMAWQSFYWRCPVFYHGARAVSNAPFHPEDRLALGGCPSLDDGKRRFR